MDAKLTQLAGSYRVVSLGMNVSLSSLGKLASQMNPSAVALGLNRSADARVPLALNDLNTILNLLEFSACVRTDRTGVC